MYASLCKRKGLCPREFARQAIDQALILSPILITLAICVLLLAAAASA
jgi:hypothetical protein